MATKLCVSSWIQIVYWIKYPWYRCHVSVTRLVPLHVNVCVHVQCLCQRSFDDVLPPSLFLSHCCNGSTPLPSCPRSPCILWSSCPCRCVRRVYGKQAINFMIYIVALHYFGKLHFRQHTSNTHCSNGKPFAGYLWLYALVSVSVVGVCWLVLVTAKIDLLPGPGRAEAIHWFSGQ